MLFLAEKLTEITLALHRYREDGYSCEWGIFARPTRCEIIQGESGHY